MIKIYICNDCGYSFEEPEKIVETHYEIPPPNKEYFYCCPCCGGEDFDEIIYVNGKWKRR